MNSDDARNLVMAQMARYDDSPEGVAASELAITASHGGGMGFEAGHRIANLALGLGLSERQILDAKAAYERQRLGWFVLLRGRTA